MGLVNHLCPAHLRLTVKGWQSVPGVTPMTLRVRQKWALTANALTCGLAELAAKTNLSYVNGFSHGIT